MVITLGQCFLLMYEKLYCDPSWEMLAKVVLMKGHNITCLNCMVKNLNCFGFLMNFHHFPDLLDIFESKEHFFIMHDYISIMFSVLLFLSFFDSHYTHRSCLSYNPKVLLSLQYENQSLFNLVIYEHAVEQHEPKFLGNSTTYFLRRNMENNP